MNPNRQQTRPWSGVRPTQESPKQQSRSPSRRPPIGKARKRKHAQNRTPLQRLQRKVAQIALGFAVTAAVLFASLDVTTDLRQPSVDSQWMRSAGARPVWMVDLDGDGATDFANPTRTQLRGNDIYGSGRFLAGRDHARRKHMGTDFTATPGDPVRAPISGVVTLIGAAYGNDPYLRFIEVVSRERKLNVRLFYVQPGVAVGKEVKAGDIIGAAQSLDRRYPLITNHVHVEMRNSAGRFLDPALVLPPARPTAQTFAAAVAKAPARRARAAAQRATGTLPAEAVTAAAAVPGAAAAQSAEVTAVTAPRAVAPVAASAASEVAAPSAPQAAGQAETQAPAAATRAPAPIAAPRPAVRETPTA
ncbi:MAG: M23 family metallopeptidase [Hyphomonadaceae bacterium]|nr:M23 family metallopeptidase [Hyphomonadaceae bacterium]